jgi:hypothetical protein
MDAKRAVMEKLDAFEDVLPSTEEYEIFTDKELEAIGQAFEQLYSLFLDPLIRIRSPKYQVAHFFNNCGAVTQLVVHERERKREKQQRQKDRETRKAMKCKKAPRVASDSGGILIPFPTVRKTA